MGNCFGKPKSDNFSGSGQTLANANSTPAPKPVIAAPNKPVSASYAPTPAQGRVVGGSSPAPSSNDPRVAAAMAAEERLRSSQSKSQKGKLGKQLDAQKSQSHNKVLDETSRETRLARDADANVEVRTWN
ncbi:hypothetical protein D6C86_06851 [Aureobasidium pullulans]|uniref:Uncharacterized protein n=2 Tax=Aureobasidium pullulans TaxID=5580 RepID=A0A074X8W8_AURPU|nr:uncharacterized protein M438DRAFT_285583 [Aureobasidium pullulans EXF-150]THX35756.1 hypothetical protein D6D12_00179 [Aureobasidium pullulans]KEQ78512.1 hypothetical protein M438DRAFT_285583 [Aureobasidium pullulans EXF-150]THX62674.1 hypothetical protein D6D11_02350 [Aureobasidium pullulans]THY41744.1 hypothetical protein D6C99_07714 [Aureobasidium pullulans]THY71402.1 hypothetical protein D6C94_07683 [Aureobasidium pullulans]